MNSKCYLTLLISAITFIAFSQKQQADYYYQGENGESLVRDMQRSHNPYYNELGWFFVDSLSNQPYTGVATTWLSPYNSPENREYSAVDSMCISNGVVTGYRKEYGRPFSKEAKAGTIEFTNHTVKYQITTSNLLAPFNSKFTNISSAFLDIYLNNISFYCSIKYKKDIKLKVVLSRYGNEIRKPLIVKQNIRLKDQGELESYLKSFPDIISQEILNKCKSLGMFDNDPIDDPIIRGNCDIN